MRKTLVAALLIAGLLPLNGQARNSAFEDPVTINVASRLAQADIEQVARAALQGRGWQVRDVGGGVVEALQVKQGYDATIQVSSTTSRVMIKYLDSHGMDYERDGRRQQINPHYVMWINFLVKDISKGLRQASFK